MDISNLSGSRRLFSPTVQSPSRRLSLKLGGKKTKGKFIPMPKGQGGEIILKTQFNTVESFGLPLPVLVTETLTFANQPVSVKFSPNGWCWLVCGRKLLVWHYRETKTSGKSSNIATCRELQLPQTDLAYKAHLITVFFVDNTNQMPSVVGVSPEGIIRYWPSVAQEGTYVDESADLQGQECDILTDIMPLGCLLATTTSTMVMVQPALSGGRQALEIRTLRPPTGWLGGIGRRVSLLFFGSMQSAQMVENKLIGVKILESLTLPNEEGFMERDGPYVVCMSTGPNIQLWKLFEEGERLLYEITLGKPLRDACLHAQMQPQAADVGTLDIYVLDMHPSANGLLLLVAAVNLTRSPDMRYALAQVSLEENPPSRITQFVPLKIAAIYRNEPECEAMALKFLHLADRAYLYTTRELWVVSSTIPNEKPDYVELGMDNNKIHAGELCHNTPLIFTKNHGIVAIIPNDYVHRDMSMCESPIGSPMPAEMYDGHLSLYEIDPHEVSLITTDVSGKLKTALLYHVRRDAVACKAIIQELFPELPQAESLSSAQPRRHYQPTQSQQAPEQKEIDVDATLDRTVLQIASELIDDVPSGDPRWDQTTNQSKVTIPLGSSTALQILSQLRDKQQAFNLFIDFLRASGLWQRLGLVSKDALESGVCESISALWELWEKLAIAVALRKLQQAPYQNIVDAAVHKVVELDDEFQEGDLGEALRNGVLSHSDLFYKRVSTCHKAIIAAVPTRIEPKLIQDTNGLLLGVLQEVQKCRLANSWPPRSGKNDANVAWSSSWMCSAEGLIHALVQQHYNTVAKAAHQCQDQMLKSQLYDQGVSLAEHILAELRENAQNSKREIVINHYCNTRKEVIQLYLDEKQFTRAAILAEKFLDFDMLIQICVQSDDMNKLYAYMDKYSNEGMCERTFEWLCKSGRGSELIRRLHMPTQDARASAWLSRQANFRSIYGAFALRRERYEEAAAAFAECAANETSKVSRANTASSLAKLCLQVGDETSTEANELKRQIEANMTLIEQHNALPKNVLIAHGLLEDAANNQLRVYTPLELIDLYITTDNRNISEYDYMKALELVEFIEEPDEKKLLRLKIWCAAILQDDWTKYDPSCPLDAVQDKVFFRLVELTNLMGCNLDEYIPTVEEILNAQEVSELSKNTGFQFILKYGFEYMDRSMNEE